MMAIDANCAGVTVSKVEPVADPDVALMFAVPAATLVASPVLPTVAVDVVSDDQVADAVRFCVLPSVKVPVAVNCCVVPSAIEAVWGVTAIETRVAVVTVNTVLPLTDPDVAVIVAVPVPALGANP